MTSDLLFPVGTPLHGFPDDVGGITSIPALRAALDPRRVPFNLPDIGKTLMAHTDYPQFEVAANNPWPIRSRTGWESGQAGGIFTHREHRLLHAMTFVAQAGGKAIMPCDAHLWSPEMVDDPFKIGFLKVATLKQFETETGVTVGLGSIHCALWCLGVLELEHGLYLCQQFIPGPVLEKGAVAAREWLTNYIVEYINWSVTRGVYGASCFFGPGAHAPQVEGYDWTPDRVRLYMRMLNRMKKLLEPILKACHEAAKTTGPDGLSGRIFKLLHEIHARSIAQCATDFGNFLHAMGYDEAIGVWNDSSHCSDGEPWHVRMNHPAVKGRGCGGHNKARISVAGRHTRMAGPDFIAQAKVFGKMHESDDPLDLINSTMVANGDGGRYAHLTCQDASTQGGYLFVDLHCEAELPTAAFITREERRAAIDGVGGKRNQFLVLPSEQRGAASSGISFCNGYLQNTWDGTAFYEKMGAASA